MRVFVAGATGALGRRLVPRLVARGHETVGTTRSASKAPLIRAQGADAVIVDALDPAAVERAVVAARPDVVVHQLTALSGPLDMRRPDRTFAETNRLRTVGTDHLVRAARTAGARRFVAQSFAGWPFARTGGPVKTEADALDPAPPDGLRPVLAAIRHLEAAVTGASDLEGLVLRYGFFYGPGTAISLDPGAEMTRQLRKRVFPVVGSGAGIWSFIHIDDAAAATIAAIEQGRPGLYHVVDDDPAPVRDWLPELARAVGAKPPRKVPTWLGRLLAGEAVVTMMTESRGASNAKAKHELRWAPAFPTWRDGFASALV